MSAETNVFSNIADLRAGFRIRMLKAVQEGLAAVAEVASRGRHMAGYHQWPSLTYRENGLPQLTVSSFQTPTDYKRCFGDMLMDPLVDGKALSSFNELVGFVKQHPALSSRFDVRKLANKAGDLGLDWPDIHTRAHVQSVIDRYVHVYGTFAFNADKAQKVVAAAEGFVFDERLRIDIVVPILLLNFDLEEGALTNGVRIKRVNDKLHLARATIRSGNVSVHDSVVSAATHAFIIENWEVPNTDTMFEFDILRNPRAYPLAMIDRLFGAIRLVTGLDTGYSQILAVANGWERYTNAALPHIEGCALRAYPSKFEGFYWNHENIPNISPDQVTEIGAIYAALEDANEKSVHIALSRLNTCLVRDTEEDAVLDATTALEALLTNDSTQEITHRLALRVGAVSTLSDCFGKTPQQVFRDIKSIYAYRSAIVHGSTKIDKKRMIKIDKGNEVPASTLAVEYLRKLLRILIENPYFRDVKRIDEELLLRIDS